MSRERDKDGGNRVTKEFLSGNQAIGEAVMLARTESIAAYPITPQTGIVNHLVNLISSKKFAATMVHAESESSALSIVVGSTLGGIRSFTATSSQGLLMMAEATYYTSGMRVPLVMTVVNRGLSAPVTIFSDHQDSMTLRDNGWLQFYCKNGQEALDTILTSYAIAEHRKVLLPVMVCIDGFAISHRSEPIVIPSQQSVDEFLPSFSPEFPYMTLDEPKFLGTAAWPDYYEEFVYLRNKALKDSQEVIIETCNKYSGAIRPIVPLISTYNAEEAEIIIIGIGSMMSTLEVIVDQLNDSSSGSVGLIRLKCFRPFPAKEILSKIKSKSKIIVLDKAVSPGQSGPLFLEISSILQTSGENIDCYGFILGLGGRELTLALGKRILHAIKELDPRSTDSRQYWIDLNHETIKRWTTSE